MGYLRGTQTQAIKGTVNGNNKPSNDDIDLKLKASSSSSSINDYLKQSFGSLDASAYAARRRMFEVNGDPLDHWKEDNFEPKRDATCRVIYEPKMGKKFFSKTLRVEDYAITRGLTTSLEQPYFSKYNRFFPKKGHFCCKACGNPLYSSEAKFDVDDGWPAFGACVLGSIGVTPVEDRIAQIKKMEQACIKIQAFVRGHQCRHKVETMLDELIQDLLRRKYEQPDDWSSEGHESSDFSWSSSSSSDDSDLSKQSKGSSDGGYVLSRNLGDDYAEIHCHRCKSHLGDAIAQKNTGSNGETYRERHRVNGRALKYMDGDLPKRTMRAASLLFADASQRQRFGLPDIKENDDPASLPFGTLHWLRNPSGSLSTSNHETSFNSGIHRKASDPFSVSCHTRSLFQTPNYRKPSPPKKAKVETPTPTKQRSLFQTPNYRKPSPPKKAKVKTPTPTKQKKKSTKSRRRPMRRGGTDTSINIAERTKYLENAFTHYTPTN